MGEYTDLYNENKELTGDVIYREKGKKAIVPNGKYIIVVLAFIINSEGKYLIQKTSPRKNGVWAFPGGHVKSGQTSLEGIIDELKEEMGLEFDNIELFKTYKYENAFKDVYIIKSDVNTENLVLQSDEVELAKFLTVEEINELIKNSMVRTTNLDAFNDLVNNIYKMN